MKLNYKTQGSGQAMILLHGLFGNLDNLAILAREFANQYQVIQVDLRNHGQSPWCNEMDYQLMAGDILALIEQLKLKDVILVAHSMGGKVAMQLTQNASDLIAQIIVLDIAPICYKQDSHADVFTAINAALASPDNSKKRLQDIMRQYLPEETVQFLLKSYKSDHFLFNFSAIEHHYCDIRGWDEISPYREPILFIKGSQSDYIIDEYYGEIVTQFPYATIDIIEGAGHNVHYDAAKDVIQLIQQWIS